MTQLTLSQYASGEWRDFSLYTIEERAIPSMIDGFKPVQRFIMYSALKNAKNRWLKVSALAAVAEYGYHHGDAAAQDAALKMGSDWNNNLPVLLGDGNFGDRLVNAPAAPRYVFAQVNPKFFDIFTDLDLCPVHENPEHIPPKYYLPTIPMVLVNGVSGIATGYATDIPPYSVESITKLCKAYMAGKDIDAMPIFPKFYGFKGRVENNTKSGFDIIGTVELKGKTTAIISEVPFGYDREGYIKVLDDLEEEGKILRYDEDCGEHGFLFRVDLKRGADTMTNDELVKLFKLRKSIPQNITVLDQDRKLRKYNTPQELVKDFCDFRLTFYSDRIAKQIRESEQNLKVAIAKIKFINMVLNNLIVFKGKSRAELTKELTQTFDKDIVPSLLGMDFGSLTQDEIRYQMANAKKLDAARMYWKNATPKGEFVKDLEQI